MTKDTNWLDAVSLAFITGTVTLFAYWTVQADLLGGLFQRDQAMTWQVIRASGLTAYMLFTASTLWGLALSSKIVKDWSPGTLSMLLHTSVSWLGVGFAAVHAVLLLFDEYVTYRVSEILVPFTGPYRPLAVGLGTLTFWIMLLVASSFSIKKRLGHQRWKLLHYTSYAGFFMVTLHALLAGTDAGRIGFQILLGLATLFVVVLTGYRVGASKNGKPNRHPARTP